MRVLLLMLCLMSSLSFAGNAGFKVVNVENNNFFKHFKILEGDRIIEVNNKPVASLNDLMSYMGDYDKIESIVVIRDGKKKTYNRLKH